MMKHRVWGVGLFLCVMAMALSSSAAGSQPSGLRTEVLATNHLTTLITTYYGDPNRTTADAVIQRERSDRPMEINVVPCLPQPSNRD